MLLRCGGRSNRRSMSASSSVPPHPQPFSPATKASTTRPRRGGEGSQNESWFTTPIARSSGFFGASDASTYASSRNRFGALFSKSRTRLRGNCSEAPNLPVPTEASKRIGSELAAGPSRNQFGDAAVAVGTRSRFPLTRGQVARSLCYLGSPDRIAVRAQRPPGVVGQPCCA